MRMQESVGNSKSNRGLARAKNILGKNKWAISFQILDNAKLIVSLKFGLRWRRKAREDRVRQGPRKNRHWRFCRKKLKIGVEEACKRRNIIEAPRQSVVVIGDLGSRKNLR